MPSTAIQNLSGYDTTRSDLLVNGTLYTRYVNSDNGTTAFLDNTTYSGTSRHTGTIYADTIDFNTSGTSTTTFPHNAAVSGNVDVVGTTTSAYINGNTRTVLSSGNGATPPLYIQPFYATVANGGTKTYLTYQWGFATNYIYYTRIFATVYNAGRTYYEGIVVANAAGINIITISSTLTAGITVSAAFNTSGPPTGIVITYTNGSGSTMYLSHSAINFLG
jgi:hypothetical protein